jgi:hypothetical protein
MTWHICGIKEVGVAEWRDLEERGWAQISQRGTESIADIHTYFIPVTLEKPKK